MHNPYNSFAWGGFMFYSVKLFTDNRKNQHQITPKSINKYSSDISNTNDDVMPI
jgi:hypothetical protein